MASPSANGGPQTAPRALGLAGPTASGKTALALAIARRWPVEVISVDSALVYRGMDIGTAKPSAAERAAVPHHLIDLIEPTQAYSAAQFAAQATALLGEIAARGRHALLVGGTMLYFKALTDGLHRLPQATPAVRAELDARAQREGWPALHAALAQVDPVTAARLAPNDAQRIQRALEVWQVSGRALSSYFGPTPGGDAAPRTAGIDLPLIALAPQDRAWLHQRIAQRFDTMLADGLLDEVQRLRARGDLLPDMPSMRCVGYRQAWAALDTAQAAGAPVDLPALRDVGIAATRQLAKRQLTWLRSLPAAHRVACDAADATAQVMAAVQAVLEPADVDAGPTSTPHGRR